MGRDSSPKAPINQHVLTLKDRLHVGQAWCLSVCLSVCEVQFYDIILCANLISLCTNRHVGKCFDQTLTNEREQDKRCTHAEHRMGFLCQSVSNLLSHTLPQLDDTQNKHVEGIYDSCIDKVIMCIKRKERGGGESRWERGNKRWRRDVQAATGVFVCVCQTFWFAIFWAFEEIISLDFLHILPRACKIEALVRLSNADVLFSPRNWE